MQNMRLFRRLNGFWYVEIERNQKRSLRTKDSELARRIYRKLRREYLLGRLTILESGPQITLNEFRNEYIRDRRNKKAGKTADADNLALGKFIDAIGNKKLNLVSERDFDVFVDHCLNTLKNKKTTVNVHLRHLRGALNKAEKLGYIKKNPLVKYDFPEQEDPPTRFLLPEDILKLINLMSRDGELELIALLLFYFLTGARRNEIFNLEAGDIKEDIGFIHVRKSKAKKERWVPIPPQLYEVIEEFNLPTKGKIFTRYRHPDTVTHKIKSYLIKAGFKEFRLHDLRHTFASILAMSGASQKDLKELLGHRDIRTTDRYTHLARKYLQEVVSGHGIAINLRSIKKLELVKD